MRFGLVALRLRVRATVVCLLPLLLLAAPMGAAAQPPSLPPTADYGDHSIGEVQYALSAGGGDGTFSWEVISGALPPGLSIRTDLPPWFPSGASAGIIGVATQAGEYTFTLRVRSGAFTADQVTTMSISNLTLVDYWELPDGYVGKPFTLYGFTAANAAGTLTWSLAPWATLPPGITLNAAGQLSGTPTAAGFYNPAITISDGIHSVSRTYNLYVYDVEITTPRLLPNATVGQPYSTTITASGGTAPYTFSLGGSIAGLSLDPNTGVLSGVPTFGTRVSFNVSVVDDDGISQDKVFALNVVSPPAGLPMLSTFGSRIDDCSIGVPCARWVGTGSSGVPPFTFTASGLPSGMEIRTSSDHVPRWLQPTDAILIGTPLASGDYSVTVTVTDATGAQASNVFPLRVSTLYLNPYPVGGMFTGAYF